MYKKIDIYLKNSKGFHVYDCSTNTSKTCKDAKEVYRKMHYISTDKVRANFRK